jgi:hypothetical protein
MPGIEQRLAHYPQFCSRIGFVHEFRPLAAAETRQPLEQRWAPPGVKPPEKPLDPETVPLFMSDRAARSPSCNWTFFHGVFQTLKPLKGENSP